MKLAAAKIYEKMQQEQATAAEDNAEYCSICYTNELKQGDKGTVSFDCGHQFCSECTIEMLK